MKKLFLIVSIICFVSCFPANADTRDVAPLEKVSIQLKWFHQFQFAGYYAAAEKGFYAEEGLEVTLKERNPQKSPIRSVLDGDVTYGVADAGLLAERMKGEPVVLLKQIYQHSPLVFITLKKSGIITPYDLVGKKVMVGTEGISNAALLEMMLTTIDDMGKVTSIPHSYNLDDLIAGKVDAVAAYITSQTYKLKQQGIEFYIINPRNFGIDFYGDNLFTTEKEIQAHPDRVKKMIRATLKGWEYALAHPQEIIDLILEKYNPDLNRDQLVYEAKMTDLMILSEITPLGTVTTQRYKEIAETYKNTGLTETAPIDWRTFIYGSAPEPARHHGILLTPEEESWLKEHPVIRLGFTHLEPLVIEGEKGSLSGYYVDLLEEINTLLGSSITIELDDIDRTMQKVRNRQVDGLLVSSLPRALESDLLATTSLHEVYPIIFASSDAPFAINSLDDLAGKRVAYREDVRAFEKVLKPYKENSTLFPTESTLASLKMVLEGTADVALGFNVENYLIAKHLISGIKVTFLDLAHSFPAVTAIRNDWPELVSILDKAFETIGTARIEKIYSKWVQVEKQPAATLNLTQLEQDWLEKHPEITLSGGELPGIDFLGKDGDLKGFAPNYIRVLEDLIGIKFNLVSDTWIDAVKKVKNKEVDGMRFLHITEARQEYMNFTAPYTVVVAAGIWTRKESPEIPSMNDVQDETIGVVSGSSALKYLLDNFPDKNIIEFTTYDEGIDLLIQGKIDVLISPAAVTRYLISSKLIYDLKLTGNIPELTRGIHIGIRKDWPELVAILNKAMAVVPDDVKSGILKESKIPIPEKEKAEVLLTPEEQAWLGKNHVVRVRVSDAPPWEINTPKPQGMSVDYLTIIGRQFGINFKFLPGTDAWIDGFNDMAGDHLKYDLLPAVKRTPERLELLAISDDYLHSPWVVFTHEKIFDIYSLEYLRGRKVAVERGYVMQKLLEKNEPEIELVIQESTEDALLAVATMKADAYVGNLIVTSHLIQRAGIINVKVACPTPFGSHSQAMATRQEWTPLISIINKGLTNISQKEKTNIENKYSSVRFEHGIRIMDIIKWVIGVSSVLLTILSIILIGNRRLKSLVAERTAKLEVELDQRRQAEKKYHDFVHNSFEAVWAYDLEPPLPMDLTAEEQLDLLYERAYISEANYAVARMLGFEKGENMLGMRLDDFQPRKNPENLAYVKNLVREKYNIQNFETTAFGAAGEMIIVISNILGIRKNGKLVRIWGTSRDVTEKKQLEEELIRNKKDLQKLAGWLISRQENECSRVARELHDDLTQKLAVIAIEAGTIKEQFKDLPEPVRQKVSHLKDQLIKVSKDVHKLSRGLHPSILYDLGLERAVRSECSNFSKRTGIAVVFEPGNVPSNVPTEISLTLYRIIQECLLNISKHAKTKSAYVILERSNGSVVLTVKDAGAGFNKEEVRGQTALGFSGMRERVRLVNGTLSVTSEPGKGTTVEVEIPLKQGRE